MTAHSQTQQSQQSQQSQTYIQLGQRAMQAAQAADLCFTIVNETKQLIPYRQATYFAVRADNKLYLQTASGLVSVAENTPYSLWLNRLAHMLDLKTSKCLRPCDVPADIAEHWVEWLPEHVLTIPLIAHDLTPLGLVLFARDDIFTDQEVNILVHLHQHYAYCLDAIRYRKTSFLRRLQRFFSLRYFLISLIVLLALLFLPVRLTTLAPAEVIALNAVSVAAPQDGVIAKFYVKPNDSVKKGDILFTLDHTNMVNRIEVARKSLSIAEADALVAQQRAFDDVKGKAELATSLGRVREKEAELASVQALFERLDVIADQDGIAVFTDANDWIGKPLQTGERVMQIADPNEAGLLMWLPVRDALNLEKGSPMKLFLHTQPLKPITATLIQTSYQATLSPDNVASYRLKGQFDTTQQLPRIGLRGTARISGEWSVLGYYLFRRPIAALREWTGL